MSKWIDEGVYADGHDDHVYSCPFCGEHIIAKQGNDLDWCPGCGNVMLDDEMNNEIAVQWLESLKNDLGQQQFSALWHYEQAITGICKMLKEQPKWIPVTKELPKSMANKVLVYLDHEDLVGYIGYGHFERYNGTETWYDLEHLEPFANGYFVTHWMSLPEKP